MGRGAEGGRPDDAETCDRTATCETTGLHPSVQASGPEGRARAPREARGRARASDDVRRRWRELPRERRVSLTMRSQNARRADFRAIADGDALMRGNMDMRDLWVLADRIMLYYYLPPPVNEDSRGRLTLRTLYNP